MFKKRQRKNTEAKSRGRFAPVRAHHVSELTSVNESVWLVTTCGVCMYIYVHVGCCENSGWVSEWPYLGMFQWVKWLVSGLNYVLVCYCTVSLWTCFMFMFKASCNLFFVLYFVSTDFSMSSSFLLTLSVFVWRSIVCVCVCGLILPRLHHHKNTMCSAFWKWLLLLLN